MYHRLAAIKALYLWQFEHWILLKYMEFESGAEKKNFKNIWQNSLISVFEEKNDMWNVFNDPNRKDDDRKHKTTDLYNPLKFSLTDEPNLSQASHNPFLFHQKHVLNLIQRGPTPLPVSLLSLTSIFLLSQIQFKVDFPTNHYNRI